MATGTNGPHRIIAARRGHSADGIPRLDEKAGCHYTLRNHPDTGKRRVMADNMMNTDLMRMHVGMWQKDFRRYSLWHWVRQQLIPGGVLDAGGGSGYMTIQMLAAGYEVTLAEPDPQLAEFAERQVQENGLASRFGSIRAELEALDPETTGSFENIVCLDVLEHIEDDYRALRHVAGLLAPGGRLIVSVPALPRLYGTRDVAYGHYRRYTRRSLQQLIEGCGLAHSQLRYWNLLGIAPYYFYEKVLRKPVNDELRQGADSLPARSLRALLTRWLKLETRLPLWAGLSLLAVAHHPDTASLERDDAAEAASSA
jgi:2-polyprenyl-3-methyl-5-hydroxy-6-metoxy-1,4-benzoquinol methylase